MSGALPSRGGPFPRRRWAPPVDPTDPEDMYPPVVTGPPPPEIPRRSGDPLEVSGAEYNFETGEYTFTYECDEGEELEVSAALARSGAKMRGFCKTCHQHHDLAPIRGV